MDINQRIEDFQSAVKQNQDIAKQLYKLTNGVALPIQRQQIKTGTYFFRARTISNILDLQNWNQKDFQAKPAYKITEYGRLNFPHEAMLYFTNDSEQILKEVNYNYQSPMVIAVYQAVQSFNSVQVAQSYSNNGELQLTKTELHETNACINYFKNIFQSNADAKDNQITTILRENFYRLPQDLAQAWTFPTIDTSTKGIYNLAIYPGVAKELLKFKGAIVISKANPLGLKEIDYCFDENYRLDYVRNYPELQQIFNIK